MLNIKWKSEAGKPPTKKLLKEASELASEGSKTHLVVAMAMRPDGLTQKEVITLLGHPYRNRIKKLVQEDKVKEYELPDASRARRIRIVKKH